jgi:single-stranded-DNA-specific exonuclease
MKWQIINQKNISETEEIIKILLANRGLKNKKEIEDFLKPKEPQDLTAAQVGISPVQLKKAILRIKQAIKKKEKIIVYGDFDTDGVCGTAILWEALHHFGANVLPFIPKRDEGYGLKAERLEKMAKDGIGLIITVDQGIVAYTQAQKAKKLGIDLIITDHHTLGEKKPQALAIVYTKELAGCGVAWFLSRELYSSLEEKKNAPGLDLVAIGTITDLVPLIGPNRSLVKYGLSFLSKTQRPGLRALFDFAGLSQKELGVFESSYIIGPRINAAGRMDDPMESLRLICTTDESRAISLAQKIDQRNRERQILTQQMMVHARELLLKEDKKNSLIFISHESYQEGVIGLVAGKLTEEFYLPSVVVAQGKEISRASARSINEFNIIEAIRECQKILKSHGGHPRAAGFTIETEKITMMKEKLLKIAGTKLKNQDLSPTLKIDLKIDLDLLTPAFFQELKKLEPFGEGNPQPVFLSSNVKVIHAQTVGSEKQHLKLRLGSLIDSSFTIEAIGFGLGSSFSQLSPEQKIEIVYNLTVNEWNGHQGLQLKIKDLKGENSDGKKV